MESISHRAWVCEVPEDFVTDFHIPDNAKSKGIVATIEPSEDAKLRFPLLEKAMQGRRLTFVVSEYGVGGIILHLKRASGRWVVLSYAEKSFILSDACFTRLSFTAISKS
jgi:hypothetical protein